MNVEIKNCNNIDDGNIEIIEKLLNIKYAINGTGKSTIANSMICSVNDMKYSTHTLAELKPFKYLADEDHNPEIHGCETINSIMVFDETYLKDYTFTPDELLKGSFDIFIRDENYTNGLNEIEDLVETIKSTFIENKDIDELISDFNTLSDSFGRSTKTGIHGSSILAKAFKNGNKVENIPEELKEYQSYIQHSGNYKWIKWQLDGKGFIDITENCPYCVTNIEQKKEKIVKITEIYDSKSIQNLNVIVEVFQKLNIYFSDDTKEIIDEFIRTIDGYSDEQVDFLREVKEQIDRLNLKFNKAKTLSFKSLKDVEKIIEELKEYKIDLKLYSHLNSENTKSKSDIVNSSVDVIIKKAGVLQGKVNQQNLYIKSLIEKNKANIDAFLRNAGYNYSVNLIENAEGQHQLKLIHNDIESVIENVTTHLSFGERNAFALVLFMFDALKTNPDLIILDDPISSFDKNKKYAIVEMLFRKNHSFKDKTVLLLTHDLEPIIDMVHHHRDRFTIPKAYFLENCKGNLIEKEISRMDIQTFIEINKTNIEDIDDSIKKIVYLRRLYEITNNTKHEYHIISSLLHKKDAPEYKEGSAYRALTEEEIESGENEIKELIEDFDYAIILEELKNDTAMIEKYFASENNYEKLHIYRMIFENKTNGIDSDVIRKFINEACHIENDYIYQLNPRKFQMVPQFVINECDRIVGALT